MQTDTYRDSATGGVLIRRTPRRFECKNCHHCDCAVVEARDFALCLVVQVVQPIATF